MKTIYIPTVLAALLVTSNCRETEERYSDAKLRASTVGDVTFARRTFEALARGESSVADKIDWPVFTMVGTIAVRPAAASRAGDCCLARM